MATATKTQTLAWTVAIPLEPRIVHPGLAGSVRHHLRLDQITVERAATGTDYEGDPTGGTTVIVADRGTLAAVSAQEELVAQERGTRVDKALLVELGMDVQPGDVVTVKGVSYEVVSADNLRLHRRALVRKA